MIHGRYAPGFAAGPLEIPTVGGALRLRRPVESDLAAVIEIHTNPATNVHNPGGPLQDVAQGRVLLERWLVDWHERGLGYWAVEADVAGLDPDAEPGPDTAGQPVPDADGPLETDVGGAPARARGAGTRRGAGRPHRDDPDRWRVVGFSGVRHLPAGPTQVLNLYYRYAPAAWGRGWATAVALRAREAADREAPELPVIARMMAGNVGSRRVAEKAGLRHSGYDLQGRPVLADRKLPPSVIEGLPLV